MLLQVSPNSRTFASRIKHGNTGGQLLTNLIYRAFDRLRVLGFGNSRNIPSLDGLRGVAVAIVLLAHLCGTAHFVLPADSPAVWLGNFGVRIFFVISGYLITTLLLAEQRKTGTVSLRRFYFRRSLRLFPAAYVFLAAMALLAYFGVIALKRFDLLAGVTYTMNYYEDRSLILGHLWSLAIEEQFYLIWPFVFLLLGDRGRINCLKWVLIVTPAFRLLTPFAGASLNFVTSADVLGTGCLLALIQRDLEKNDRYRRFFKPTWMIAAAVLALACNYLPSFKLKALFGETTMNLCIALVIHWLVLNPNSRVGKVLNWMPLVFLGILSYSVYLWQQPFLHFGMNNTLTEFPLNLVLTFTLALLSYLLVEVPSLRLRSRLIRKIKARDDSPLPVRDPEQAVR